MRLDFGVDTVDFSEMQGVPEKVELLGMRGRKHALQFEPWAEFRAHLRDLRGMPTRWSVDEDKKHIRVWPAPNMAMHIKVTMKVEPEPVVIAETEILPPLPKRKGVERRA